MNNAKQILVGLIVMGLIFPHQAFAKKKEKAPVVALIPAIAESDSIEKINAEFVNALQYELKDKFSIIDFKTSKRIQDESKRQISQDPLEDFFALTKKAKDQYHLNKDINGALEIFHAVQKGLHELESPTQKSSELLTNSYFAEAYVLYQSKRFSKAEEVLKKVYKYQQDNDLNGFGKPFKGFARIIKPKIEAEKFGFVSIKSSPKSVDVFVDGFYFGATPKDFKVPSGQQAIVLNSSDRKQYKKVVNVRPEKTVRLFGKLKWKKTDSDDRVATDWQGLPPISKLAFVSRISERLNANKSIVVNVQKRRSSFVPCMQVYDHEFDQSFKEHCYSKKISDLKNDSQAALKFFVRNLQKQISNPASSLWKEDFDKSLVVDLRIDERPRKPLYKKKAFWAVVGGVLISGLVYGIASSSRGSNAPQTGGISVDLGGLK